MKKNKPKLIRFESELQPESGNGMVETQLGANNVSLTWHNGSITNVHGICASELIDVELVIKPAESAVNHKLDFVADQKLQAEIRCYKCWVDDSGNWICLPTAC